MDKEIEDWTAGDFFNESMRTTGDDDPKSDAVACGAILLASVREGPRLTKLAKATGLSVKRTRPFFEQFKAGKVFNTNTGKILIDDWSDPQSGGIAFNCDVAVGLGLLKRA